VQLSTRLTSALGIEHPIVLAPMALASGGRLAAAVTGAGGLGLIGGGYGDEAWLRHEFEAAAGEDVGCGLITWNLANNPQLLDLVLEYEPVAVMLAFGDPAPFADKIHAAGSRLFCQVNTVREARAAVEAGADVIVAQGGEAGGHGTAARSTFTFVPELADLLTDIAPATPLLAAGGVADGRGIAAALTLGADGVMVGTRFWAAAEALVSPIAQQRAVAASGDDTIRTAAYDIVRNWDWPSDYEMRVLRNSFVDEWLGQEEALRARQDEASRDYRKALAADDFDFANVTVGEAIGQINEILPAADLIRALVTEAADALELRSLRADAARH
jgi:nitronate monooxygenase